MNNFNQQNNNEKNKNENFLTKLNNFLASPSLDLIGQLILGFGGLIGCIGEIIMLISIVGAIALGVLIAKFCFHAF